MDYNEELEASLHFTLPFQVTATILFTIIFIIGLGGNIMVIYVVFKSPGMQTLTNFYLVSLAFSDSLVLLIAVTGVPVPLASVYKYTTIYGAAGSAMIYLTQYVGFTFSALSITAVAIERYIGICHPLKAKIPCIPKRALWVIVAIWTFSILSGSCWLYIFTTKTIVLPNGVEVTVVVKRMDVKSSPHQVIYALDFLISYVLPLTVTAVLYTLIGLSLRKSSKAVRQATSCKSAKTCSIIWKITSTSIKAAFQQSLVRNRNSKLTHVANNRLQVIKMITC